MKKEIGDRIKDRRKAQGLTQEQLAGMLGISQELVNKWELALRDMKTEQIIAVAQQLNTTTDYLLRGIEPENIDFCEKTGLTQETISALAAFKAKEGNSLIGFLRRYILNGMAQNNEPLYSVAVSICTFVNPKVTEFLSKDVDQDSILGAAIQYQGGAAFGAFLTGMMNNKALISFIRNGGEAHAEETRPTR